MKTLKYVDFWKSFDIYENYFSRLFKGYIEVTDSDDADVLFYSCFGHQHTKNEKSIKFYYTGENKRPNFAETDYAIGFDYINSDRYLRWPLYNLYGIDIPDSFDNSKRNSFCSMVISAPICAYRNQFFEYLNSIKKVDSGGKYRNNIGYPVKDKHVFLMNYKFSITFENSSYPGYTTEKILEAKRAGCIPIYWGNPLVEREFNNDAFINVHSYSSWKDVVDFVLKIDKNDSLFQKIQTAPLITDDTYTNPEYFKEWFFNRINNRAQRVYFYISKQKPHYVFPGMINCVKWKYRQCVFTATRLNQRYFYGRMKRIFKRVLNA